MFDNGHMRQNYPSDISREQFEQIRPLLESGRKRTSPRSVDLYDVFCGVLYILKSGCQWRMLPSDFPKWQTVYYYWRVWNNADDGNPSLLEQALKKSGWRGPREPWSQRHSEHGDR